MEEENLPKLKNSIWKNKNKQYLFEMQKLMDIIDNVKDERLKKDIISQTLKCDKCITELAEKAMREMIKNNKDKK